MENTLTFGDRPLTAETGRRQITGLVVPFGVYGNTSAGRVKVRPGAIRLPEDLSRVKLLNRHSDDRRAAFASVGHAISAEVTDVGVVMTFSVSDGPDGDRVLAEAMDKTNDGLSVELINVQTHGDEVAAGDMSAVAAVPMPAWSDSRVTSVAAADHSEPLTAATDPHGHDGPNQEEEMPETETVAADQADGTETETDATEAEATETNEQLTAAAQVPAFHASPRRAPGQALDRLFAAVAAVNAGHMSPELTAALADITYGAGPFADQPAYVGELWEGVPYVRRFVPLLNQRTLTSMKLKGWKWTTPPEVDDYDGDKAAIPSNEVVLDEAEATATRLAGGHDIDRAYYDFGNREVIESYYRHMANSYAKKSDALALAAIVAAAGAASATVGTDLLDAVAIGVDEIDAATGATATFALVNTADRRALLSIGANDVPAYLREILKIDPANFVASPSVAAGTVIVGAKPFMDHAELPGSPIRVSAVNIPNGGNDEAVFGYRATLLNDADGVAKVSFS